MGTGKGTSLKKLANMISSNFNGYKKIEFKKNKINNLVKNRVGSTVLAKKIIKFNYKIDLKVGLKNFIKYFDY